MQQDSLYETLGELVAAQEGAVDDYDYLNIQAAIENIEFQIEIVEKLELDITTQNGV